MNCVRFACDERWQGSPSAWLFAVVLFALVALPPEAVSAPPDAAETTTSGARATWDTEGRREGYLALPRGVLFKPLVADVRWPRFSAEHQWRLGTDEFNRVAAVSFGESFGLVRSPQYDWGEWEFGLQAMADALFDLGTSSFDLSNEDYFVALTGSVLTQGVTMLFRLYHTSSHLGDEYLLANGGPRDHVSFEVIDFLASYEPRDWMRVYGGGGALINTTSGYDPIVTQFGIELTSPMTFASGFLTPIFGTDLQLRQENDWIPDVAALVGLRLADPADDVRRLEFYARYYHGRSPDGQFFEQTIDSIGLGFRLGF